MPVEMTQAQKRSLHDCLTAHEGKESLSVDQIAAAAGLPVGQTRDLLRGVGADCGFCVVSCKGGKWFSLFSPEFWD